MTATYVQLAGIAAIAGGAWFIFAPLAPIVIGVGLLALGIAMERG